MHHIPAYLMHAIFAIFANRYGMAKLRPDAGFRLGNAARRRIMLVLSREPVSVHERHRYVGESRISDCNSNTP